MRNIQQYFYNFIFLKWMTSVVWFGIFFLLRKILQTPDYYLWQPKNLSAVKGTPTLTSMLRTKPVKEYVFGTRNRFFFRFSTYWFVWVALLFSYPPLMALRESKSLELYVTKNIEYWTWKKITLSWDIARKSVAEQLGKCWCQLFNPLI